MLPSGVLLVGVVVIGVAKVISGQHVTDISWPIVRADGHNGYTTIDCYTELPSNGSALNHLLRINPLSIQHGAPCMIRIPAGVEFLYRAKFSHPSTYFRILVGNRINSPMASTVRIGQPQLQAEEDQEEGKAMGDGANSTRFHGPIRVPCRVGILVLWSYAEREHLEFILLPRMGPPSGTVGGRGSDDAPPNHRSHPRRRSDVTHLSSPQSMRGSMSNSEAVRIALEKCTRA